MDEHKSRRRPWSLRVQSGRVEVRTSSGTLRAVHADCVARSSVLAELVESAGDGETSLEGLLSEAAFLRWMAEATQARDGPRVSKRSRHLLRQGMDRTGPLPATVATRLGDVVVAAHALLDDATLQRTTHALADFLRRLPRAVLPTVASQLLEHVPDHLWPSLLKEIPFERALRWLPPSLHGVAVCAQHPPASHGVLQLPPSSPAVLHLALPAVASLKSLRDVSLAGCQFTRDHRSWPADGGVFLTALSRLTAMTALSLRNTDFTQGAADALATVLRAVRGLRALDLSATPLLAAHLRALSAALRGSSSLGRLDLSGIRHPQSRQLRPERQTDAALALACQAVATIAPLRQLTSLAIDTDAMSDTEQSLVDLLTASCSLPDLQALECSLAPLQSPMSPDLADDIVSALRAASRLSALQLVAPDPNDPCHLGEDGELDKVAQALGSCTTLTSLHLQCSDRSLFFTNFVFRHVSSLHTLRISVLDSGRWTKAGSAVSAVARALPRLTQLTELCVSVRNLNPQEHVGPFRHTDAHILVKAVAAVRSLRRIELPLGELNEPTCRLLAILARATRVQHLQLGLATWPNPRLTDAVWAAAEPLLPHVTAMDLSRGCRFDRFSCLQPLTDALGVLSELRMLRVRIHYHAAETTAWVHRLLCVVSCLPGLRSLRLALCVRADEGAAEDDVRLDSGAVQRSLEGLRGLTDLAWHVSAVPSTRTLGVRPVLRACAVLRELQALEIYQVDEDANRELATIVPQLALTRLSIEYCFESQREVMAAVLRRLRRLRAVHIKTPHNSEFAKCLAASAGDMVDAHIFRHWPGFN